MSLIRSARLQLVLITGRHGRLAQQRPGPQSSGGGRQDAWHGRHGTGQASRPEGPSVALDRVRRRAAPFRTRCAYGFPRRSRAKNTGGTPRLRVLSTADDDATRQKPSSPNRRRVLILIRSPGIALIRNGGDRLDFPDETSVAIEKLDRDASRDSSFLFP